MSVRTLNNVRVGSCRCEPVSGDRKRPVAAGSERPREGLLTHQQTKVSADGCTGGT